MLVEHVSKQLGGVRASRLVVALSGGVDSVSLLHAVIRAAAGKSVHALHVNHGISPQADDFQRHASALCARLGVRLTCVRVAVKRNGSLEENARHARYRAFESFLADGDVLLQAHHADDQAETILMNLLRGSAAFGVGGMPRLRALGKGMLLRPLMDVRHRQLVEYASAAGLEWIEDASNDDTTHDRNYLRHELLGLLEARWPGAVTRMVAAADRDDGYAQVIDYTAKNDFRLVEADNGALSLAHFASLPGERQKNLVRYWAGTFDLPLPPASLLEELSSLLNADQDAAPLLRWQDVCLRRYKDRLFLTSVVSDVKPNDLASGARSFGAGDMLANIVKGRGLSASRVPDLCIRFRVGGERILVRHHRTLKNVMSEVGVPPWLRDVVPLIFVGEELVALPAIPGWRVPMIVADGFAAGPVEEGLEIEVSYPGQPYSH
ncbi:MAG: tRNA lysidine(34) synthetase TilS [Pseudomonadales bacterium]|nr:tRNA lysidine(34) synthetase TilS [Pseudomonadales bacterium]